MKYYSSTLISITTLMEPVFASLMAMIIFKEIPSAYTVLGGIIIIGGIYLGTYFSQEKPAGDGS